MISNQGFVIGVGAFSSRASFTCLPMGLSPGKYFVANV